MNRLTLFFAVIALTVSAGASTSPGWLLNYSDIPLTSHDLEVYRRSLNLCGNFSLKDPWTIAGDSLSQAILSGRLFKLNTKLDELIGNRWFNRALTDCFGNDTTKKVWFVKYLMVWDLLPKALVMGGAAIVAVRVVPATTEYFSSMMTQIAGASPVAYAGLQTYFTYPLVDHILRIRRERTSDSSTAEELKQSRQAALKIAEEIDVSFRNALLQDIEKSISQQTQLLSQAKANGQSPIEIGDLEEKISQLKKLKQEVLENI